MVVSMLRDIEVEPGTSNPALGTLNYPRLGFFRNFSERSVVSQNNMHEKGRK